MVSSRACRYDRVKILVTTFTYPPYADGCSEAVSVLTRGLVRLGHAVTVATGTHPGRPPSPAGANPFVESFHISGSANRRIALQATPEEIARYRRFLTDGDYDLIIFENWDAWPTYLAEPLLRGLKPKKILVSHGYTPHLWNVFPQFPWGITYWMGGWPLVLRTPWLMRQFDHLVVLSQRRDFNRFFDHWLARVTGYKSVSVIANGAFAREFNDPNLPDFRRENGLGPGLMLLFVANYCDRKNQLMAVRTFRQAQLKDATLVLIGSEINEYAEQVRQLDGELQKHYPAGKVVLLEKLNRTQTCAAYRAADLFVLTAKAETQPIVLLEAMASHTPWLSTDVGCVADLPGGRVARDEADFVAKLRELAGSPEQRQKLTAEGWTACQQTYDWEQVISAYGRLVAAVAGDTKRP